MWAGAAGATVIGGALVLVSDLALAHSGGQPGGGCVGCHSGGNVDIDVGAMPAMLGPGDAVTVTVTVSSGGGAEVGLFVAADQGTLETLAGQGLYDVPAGLTHAQPKPLQGGQASFSFRWTAPGQPGAVRFSIWTVVANGNGQSSGDLGDDAFFDLVFGCQAQEYYRDGDADGHGVSNLPLLHCADTVIEGYATPGDDCNDNDPSIHPGAPEYCNLKDDDCDGDVDEDAIPLDLYLDGDGFFGQAEYRMGSPMMGCVGLQGFAAYPGDCKPEDPEIHPDAEEVCDLLDNDCDGSVDEYVRPRCGEGWCEAEADDCAGLYCTPGDPQPETCNLLDDDCDGNVDEGVSCPKGEACIAGQCRPEDDAPGGETGGTSSTEATGDTGGTGGEGQAEGDAASKSAGCATGRHRSRPPLWWLLLPVMWRRNLRDQ